MSASEKIIRFIFKDLRPSAVFDENRVIVKGRLRQDENNITKAITQVTSPVCLPRLPLTPERENPVLQA
jgi:hypothetical protein